MKTGMVLMAVLTMAGMAWGEDFADEAVSWDQPAAGATSAESQQRLREERLLRQLEAAERRAEAAERRAAEAAGALRAEEEGGGQTGVSSPSSVPEGNSQMSPERLREERLWQQLEAAERRAEAAEEALRAEEGYGGGSALSPFSRKTIGNTHGSSGSNYGTVEVPEWVRGGSLAVRAGYIFADHTDPLLGAELNKSLGDSPFELALQFVSLNKILEDYSFWLEKSWYGDIGGVWRFRRQETISPFVGLGVRYESLDDNYFKKTRVMGQIGLTTKYDIFSLTGKIQASKEIREVVGMLDIRLQEHLVLNGFIEGLNFHDVGLDKTFFVAGGGLTIPF